MELHQLRCFIAVAEELHFGHAAQRLNMMPSALGRHIRLLEEGLGTRLLLRTTRSVSLTASGAILLEEARNLLTQADALAARFRQQQRSAARVLRIGAIDSAAVGLLPPLLHALRVQHPEIEVQITEDKTVHLLPRLRSGRLDMVFIRPPGRLEAEFAMQFLFYEDIVVAVPEQHPFAGRDWLEVHQLAGQPMLVPDRRSRPHSYDLTMNIFHHSGIAVTVSQVADEKQTIINLVAEDLGLAIVPRWISRIAVANVRYIPLRLETDISARGLPLAAAWLHDCRDAARDALLGVLNAQLITLAAGQRAG